MTSTEEATVAMEIDAEAFDTALREFGEAITRAIAAFNRDARLTVKAVSAK